jgi:hypothetical protein
VEALRCAVEWLTVTFWVSSHFLHEGYSMLTYELAWECVTAFSLSIFIAAAG